MRRFAISTLVGAAVGLVGCSGSKRSGTTNAKTSALAEGVPADSDRFPHDLHTGDHERIRGFKNRGLQCTDCHPAEAVLKGDYARPGLNEHSPCDEGQCHADEFYKPPGAFCQNCHTEVNPRQKGATKMQPYPERGFRRVLASEFSHRTHLDNAKMDSAVGFHVDCADCHGRDKTSKDPVLPGHAECARCHAEKDSARKAANMGDCANCHPKRDIDLVRGRLFIKQDLIFAHSDHVTDQGGSPIRCDTCHSDIPASRSAADVSVPAMQRCATCHEDSQKTPDRVRIARCDVCHSNIDSGSPPENHLVGKELPESHTIEFRQNHGEQARSKEANCRFCHEGLTDSTRDNCYQCHQIMRPRDHNLGWREDSHGREAAADSDRCQQCHTADYCTACHSIPPRSHQPFAEFRLGGHAQPARFDLRSCMACHTFERTCSSCHRRLR
jgi:hypothetical protein